MKQHKIFGIEFDELQRCADLFDYELDDLNFRICAVSKKTYTHKESEYDFQYKYVINIEWIQGGGQLTLSLMPTIDSLTPEFKNDVCEFVCCEPDELKYNDIFDNGGGSVDFDCMELPENAIDEDVVYLLDKCASIVNVVDSIRGFYLDKSWNKIGNDGWSILDHCLKNKPLF